MTDVNSGTNSGAKDLPAELKILVQNYVLRFFVLPAALVALIAGLVALTWSILTAIAFDQLKARADTTVELASKSAKQSEEFSKSAGKSLEDANNTKSEIEQILTDIQNKMKDDAFKKSISDAVIGGLGEDKNFASSISSLLAISIPAPVGVPSNLSTAGSQNYASDITASCPNGSVVTGLTLHLENTHVGSTGTYFKLHCSQTSISGKP